MKFNSNFDGLLPYTAIIGGVIGVGLLFNFGCNRVLNNRFVNRPGFSKVSYATGLLGHVEYTNYYDNSKEVKINLDTIRCFDFKIYLDKQGDGLVDRITEHNVGWIPNKHAKSLIRTYDYQEHKKEFDEADKKLEELMSKYDR